MLLLLYIVICIIYGLFIRAENDFGNTIIAVFSSIIVTPLFGKKLYYWIGTGETEMQENKKSLKKVFKRETNEWWERCYKEIPNFDQIVKENSNNIDKIVSVISDFRKIINEKKQEEEDLLNEIVEAVKAGENEKIIPLRIKCIEVTDEIERLKKEYYKI